jgi:predicted SAM-dependent methyltransferase
VISRLLRDLYYKSPIWMQEKFKLFYRAYTQLVFDLVIIFGKAARFVYKKPLPKIDAVKVHLGCGPVSHPDFVNIDGYPFSHVHFVSRIDKLKMLKDDSVDMIYASHCLEHFHYRDTKKILKEWRRVLKNNGDIVLSVPDLDKLVAIYKQCDNNPELIIEQLMGGQNNKYNYHFNAFNKVSLSNMLAEAGFNEIMEWKSPYTEGGKIIDFSSYNKTIDEKEFPVSLNLKAKKFDAKV